MPNWPLVLRPQHCTAPPERIAQVWALPAAIATADAMPETSTGEV